MDTKTGDVDFEKINGRLRLLTFYNMYPTMEYLKQLVESKEKDDIKVSVPNEYFIHGTESSYDTAYQTNKTNSRLGD